MQQFSEQCWRLGPGSGEKWITPRTGYLRYVLKVEPAGVADGLDEECEGKQGIKDDSEGFSLSNWEH